ncbi:MAG: riboflavin kinase [bacterium]|nr:riboflavin kinase [bacterium]
MTSYTGIVRKGTQRAAELGFSTINIPLDDASVSGIYAAKVKVGANPAEPDARPEGFREEEYEAAAYADQKRKVLEAHILDFSKDLYGWNVKIELLKKIREHKKFTDDKTLQKAIAEDIKSVREYFDI